MKTPFLLAKKVFYDYSLLEFPGDHKKSDKNTLIKNKNNRSKSTPIMAFHKRRGKYEYLKEATAYKI
jgi:hypothetical protein